MQDKRRQDVGDCCGSAPGSQDGTSPPILNYFTGTATKSDMARPLIRSAWEWFE